MFFCKEITVELDLKKFFERLASRTLMDCSTVRTLTAVEMSSQLTV